MAVRMVSRFYLTYLDAVQAVADLVAAGVPDLDISLIESEGDARLPPEVSSEAAQSPAAGGAKLGGSIGGGIGLLFGLGAISFELLDPLVHLGWFAPMALGAALGAGIGALLGLTAGRSTASRQAHAFAAGLQRGEHLVMVSIDEARAAKIEAIMARGQVVPAGASLRAEPPHDPAGIGLTVE